MYNVGVYVVTPNFYRIYAHFVSKWRNLGAFFITRSFLGDLLFLQLNRT